MTGEAGHVRSRPPSLAGRMTEAADHVVRLPRWMPADEAARVLDVSPRTLRRRAASGALKRKHEDGRALYLVQTDEADTRPDTGRTPRPDGHRTSGQAGALGALRDELAALRAAAIDAERRAAVAEYRAQLAETDPAEVEALRARIGEITAERDEARAEASALGAAMVKRHGIIKRLSRALAAARSASK